MTHDQDRITRNRQGLIDSRFDAVVCALPSDVLLLSGYWPLSGADLLTPFQDHLEALVLS